jgi:hypothetical protein
MMVVCGSKQFSIIMIDSSLLLPSDPNLLKGACLNAQLLFYYILFLKRILATLVKVNKMSHIINQ